MRKLLIAILCMPLLVYEIWLGEEYLTEFRNFEVVKTYIGFDQMKRAAA